MLARGWRRIDVVFQRARPKAAGSRVATTMSMM
jgi:hypothetical protein